MKRVSAYKDFDNLQYKSFSSIDEFKDLLDSCIEEFKKELEQKHTGVEFDRFEFGYEYDSSYGDSDNYRPTLCIYFNRDETSVEKARREEYEEETRKRKEKEALEAEDRKKKLEEMELQTYLRLKEKFKDL